MEHYKYPIDFVVTWVDSCDPEWEKEYQRYSEGRQRNDKARFRNWDLFKYWFRAIETYAPWVNKVYLVTNGTFPKWINAIHPKLVLVKHSDYIPKEFLPTFNSHTIELFMHKIPELSEHFVYFNDDTFLNAPILPDYYFRMGLPCDCNIEQVFSSPIYSPLNKFHILIIQYCNIAVLNSHYNRKEVVKQSYKRWYGKHLGLKGLIISTLQRGKTTFEGFKWRHNEQPFLKSVFEEAWEQEEHMLRDSCTRFRQDVSLNQYFIRYWQFATNKFYPVNLNACKFYPIIERHYETILSAIDNPRIKSLCLNDTPLCSDDFYEKIRIDLRRKFEEKFPNKSSFEF